MVQCKYIHSREAPTKGLTRGQKCENRVYPGTTYCKTHELAWYKEENKRLEEECDYMDRVAASFQIEIDALKVKLTRSVRSNKRRRDDDEESSDDLEIVKKRKVCRAMLFSDEESSDEEYLEIVKKTPKKRKMSRFAF